MSHFYRIFALTGLTVLTSIVHGQTAELPSSSSFHVGDRWEWRRLSDLTKLPEGIAVRSVVADGSSMAFVLDGFGYQGAKLTIPAALANSTYAESSKPWRMWPLSVGQKWIFDAAWVRPDGVSGRTKQDVEVVAYEGVDVPAGHFMAYKIVAKGYFQSSSVNNAKQIDTYWYAPDASADVKHSRDDGNRWTMELISYRRGAQENSAVDASASPVGPNPSRIYLDEAKLRSRFVGKTAQLRRYDDGLVRRLTFRQDGTASIQPPGGKPGRSGTWDFVDGKMCLHVGDDLCFLFFDELGVLKAGPRSELARWEVLSIE
jgi:hypothetical protein